MPGIPVNASPYDSFGNAFTTAFGNAGDSYLKGVTARASYEANMALAADRQADVDRKALATQAANALYEDLKRRDPIAAERLRYAYASGNNPETSMVAPYRVEGYEGLKTGLGVGGAPLPARTAAILATGTVPGINNPVNQAEITSINEQEIERVRQKQLLENVGSAANTAATQAGLDRRHTVNTPAGSITTMTPAGAEIFGRPKDATTIRGAGAGVNFYELGPDGKPTGKIIYSPDGEHDTAGQPLPANRAEMTKDPAGMMAGVGDPPMGKNVEGHSWQIVNDYRLKKASGAPTTPTEDATYFGAYEHLRTTAQWQEKDVPLPDGRMQKQWVRVPDSGPDMSSYPMPAGFSAPPKAAGSAATSTVPPGPNFDAPGLPPMTGGGAPTTTAGGAGGIPIGEPTIKPLTEATQKTEYAADLIQAELPGMLRLFDEDPNWRPKAVQSAAGEVSALPSQDIWDVARRYLSKDVASGKMAVPFFDSGDPKTAQYNNSKRWLAMAILRPESGAAIPEVERIKYEDVLFVDSSDQDPRLVKQKNDRLRLIASVRADGKMRQKDYYDWLGAMTGLPPIVSPTPDAPIGRAPPLKNTGDRGPVNAAPPAAGPAPAAAGPPPTIAAPPAGPEEERWIVGPNGRLIPEPKK